MKISQLLKILFLTPLLLSCGSAPEQVFDWELSPFIKDPDRYICLRPDSSVNFMSPIRNEKVYWEAKDVFNPATVVRNDTLFMIYRAEDFIGKHSGTSRIGLAYTTDGYNFTRDSSAPILHPDNDEYYKYEWEGGAEDPRIIEGEDGTYYLTYTAYDGDKARLFIASSKDLRTWQKHGSIFKKYNDGELVNIWSKAGAIIGKQEENRLIAAKIDGKYWMYWGESNIYMATSHNLIDWTPIEETDPAKQSYDKMRKHRTFKTLFTPRTKMYDSGLVEPGPSPIITSKGIVFIYNSRNSENTAINDPNYAMGEYACSQVLTDANDPTVVLARSEKPFLKPDQPEEITGQVNNVCFAEGLSYYKGQWFLYYGTADSMIGVATSTHQLK